MRRREWFGRILGGIAIACGIGRKQYVNGLTLEDMTLDIAYFQPTTSPLMKLVNSRETIRVVAVDGNKITLAR